MNKWWGYIHDNNSILVKRFFDSRDIQEANESDFVRRTFGPFDARDREHALDIVGMTVRRLMAREEMPELPHMKDLKALCENPNLVDAKRYMRKWGGEYKGQDDDAILAGIYKVRMTLGIKVEETTKWLTDRNYLAEPL